MSWHDEQVAKLQLSMAITANAYRASSVDRIAELEAALAAEYRNLVFMVERGVIPNVLDDVMHAETRRVLGDKAERLKTES